LNTELRTATEPPVRDSKLGYNFGPTRDKFGARAHSGIKKRKPLSSPFMTYKPILYPDGTPDLPKEAPESIAMREAFLAAARKRVEESEQESISRRKDRELMEKLRTGKASRRDVRARFHCS
jgi:hypothetical protein